MPCSASCFLSAREGFPTVRTSWVLSGLTWKLRTLWSRWVTGTGVPPSRFHFHTCHVSAFFIRLYMYLLFADHCGSSGSHWLISSKYGGPAVPKLNGLLPFSVLTTNRPLR